MAFQGLPFQCGPILPHGTHDGPLVLTAADNCIDVSRPSGNRHTAVWDVWTTLEGLCCSHSKFWAAGPGFGYPPADFVFRFELQPSHAIAEAAWPLPEQHSMIAIEVQGVRIAGHVDSSMAHDIDTSGLWAQLKGGSCQVLGITDGNAYTMGPFPQPQAVSLHLFVFGEPTAAVEAAMAALQALPGNANRVRRVTLAEVPTQVQAYME